MKLLLALLLSCLPFNGSNGGKELLDKALERCERLETLESYRDILSRYGVSDKLPLAYAVRTAQHPDLAVWTIVSLNRIEITQDGDTVEARLAALRAEPRRARRIDLQPTRPLPDTSS